MERHKIVFWPIFPGISEYYDSFIVQGHLKAKSFIKKILLSHRLHIPRIERNHYDILDILIIVLF